ncbi:unnamed protein product, partial [Vitis vinifera]|uniref:Uncharacterized protein n=1 Tax=Vitis vinifera TaxID=29760 RepID=D7UCQ5_VITVI
MSTYLIIYGNGFTLWEETTVKKGKAGKKNVVEKFIRINHLGKRTRASWR